ncbi:MAG TPA: maleylpyruvate isomerase family mycothiol-dependent enzyme [Acidimicrobiia bacterium]
MSANHAADSAVVDALADVWASMQRLGDELDEAEWKRPTECPGWTVQDNLSHIIGIESIILGLPDPAVDLGDLPHVKNDLGRSNEIWVESLRPWSGAAVLHEFRVIAASRLSALRSHTEAEWSAPSWTPVGEGAVRDLIPFRVLDSWVHELDMRRAVGRPADMESVSARLALGRLRGVLGMIVGARLRPADGTRVAFVVEGPAAFTDAYAMTDGRAVALDPPPQPIADGVDVTLHMDADTFVRLIGGRGALEVVAPAVRVEGDASLGRRVLEHMKVLM